METQATQLFRINISNIPLLHQTTSTIFNLKYAVCYQTVTLQIRILRILQVNLAAVVVFVHILTEDYIIALHCIGGNPL
jgi:hypothetical protein